MLFNSYIFWAFFAVVFALYRRLEHRGQNVLLLAASYVFYGYWDWRFLFLMLFSTVIDYFAAIAIETSGSRARKKAILIASICTQVALLGVFKYYNFFAHELSGLATMLQLPVSLPALEILLPIGISFYTFQTMSYTIDVYRGDFKATRNFIDFGLFVGFFPHLVAGPIVRARKLLPQITSPRHDREGDFREGLYLIVLGLFKKVVVADNLAAYANTIFGTEPSHLSGLECLAGIYAFAFQIYCDFSGYSSMAQGIAKWLNIDLTLNFNNPYFAVSPSDFWKRWHISLSTWFRDYLYIPLAGSDKNPRWHVYARNVLLVMLISGLWHGAAWTFVSWGAYHGVLLCIHRLFTGRGSYFGRRSDDGSSEASSRFKPLQMLITFHLVCIGWLLFRSQTISQAWEMFARIFTDFRMTDFAQSGFAMILFYAGPLIAYEMWLERKDDIFNLTRVNWLARAAVYSYWSIMLCFYPPPVSNVFIYFQF